MDEYTFVSFHIDEDQSFSTSFFDFLYLSEFHNYPNQPHHYNM